MIGQSESDTDIADIVDVAVGADEGITQDPLGSKANAAHIEHRQRAVSVVVTDLKSNEIKS